MGIIAIPAVSSSIAPQAYADTLSTILNKINGIYTKVFTNLDVKVSTRASQTSVDNLQATGDAIKSKTDNLPTDPASNSHIDTAIASIPAGASQASVNDLGTQISDSFFDVFTDLDSIMTKTNNLPTDPASNSHIDAAIASIPAGGGITCVTMDINRDGGVDKFEISPSPKDGVNLERCDLRFANLSGAELFGARFGSADLRQANLNGAILGSADLRLANLGGADLRSADLNRANLNGATVSYANLGGANLRLADLVGTSFFASYLIDADLGEANLRLADLIGAKLVRANLGAADLTGANLGGADLTGANLGGANFQDAVLIGIISTGCTGTPYGTPSSGSLPVCS